MCRRAGTLPQRRQRLAELARPGAERPLARDRPAGVRVDRRHSADLALRPERSRHAGHRRRARLHDGLRGRGQEPRRGPRLPRRTHRPAHLGEALPALPDGHHLLPVRDRQPDGQHEERGRLLHHVGGPALCVHPRRRAALAARARLRIRTPGVPQRPHRRRRADRRTRRAAHDDVRLGPAGSGARAVLRVRPG